MRGSTSRAALIGTLSRSVPAGWSRWAVDPVERRLDFRQRRAEPSQQTLAGLGGRDAAGRPVEQPDAEVGLQPPHRLAQARSAGPARPRALAEALGARHRDEGVEIAEIDFHCSQFRTTCLDHA